MGLRKWIMVILVIVLMSGCAAPEELETVSDVYVEEIPAAGEIVLSLPDDAGEEAICADPTGTLYVCENYTITMQTLPGGDLQRTLKTVTGYEADRLTVLQTCQKDLDSFRTVWTSAGENGDQLGQAEILSDGNYHYVLSVMAQADLAEELRETWQALFDSFEVSYTAP